MTTYLQGSKLPYTIGKKYNPHITISLLISTTYTKTTSTKMLKNTNK